VYFHKLFIIYQILFLISENPCPFASPAFEVTLSGLAGGEYLPLPASKGLAFPFLLTLDGYPTSPAIYAQGQGFSPKIKETPGLGHVDIGSSVMQYFPPCHKPLLQLMAKD